MLWNCFLLNYDIIHLKRVRAYISFTMYGVVCAVYTRIVQFIHLVYNNVRSWYMVYVMLAFCQFDSENVQVFEIRLISKSSGSSCNQSPGIMARTFVSCK